jgi:hypothetical protein
MNRWLSPELTQLALDNAPAPAAAPGRRRRTRTWCLRTAVAALLCGSAAFSYVAWSQVMAARPAGGAASSFGTTASESPLADPQARIVSLRENNHALRERLAALQSELAR